MRKVRDAAQILTDAPRRIPAPDQIARIGLVAGFEHAVCQPYPGLLRYREVVVHDDSPQKAELPSEESTFIMRSPLLAAAVENPSQKDKRVSAARNCAYSQDRHSCVPCRDNGRGHRGRERWPDSEGR